MGWGLWGFGLSSPEVRRLYGPDGLDTTHAMYVPDPDGGWMLWDRVNASSQEAAEKYFSDAYPRYLKQKVVADSQSELYDFVKKTKRHPGSGCRMLRPGERIMPDGTIDGYKGS